MNREDNLEYMKEYLKYALEFEKYVYIWSNAMDKVNSQMKKIYSERKDAQQSKSAAESRLAGLEAEYFEKQSDIDQKADMFDARAKRMKRTSTVAFIIMILIAIVGIIGMVALSNNLIESGEEPAAAIAMSVMLIGMFTIMAMLAPMIIFIVNKIKSRSATRRTAKLSNTNVTSDKLQHKSDLERSIVRYTNTLNGTVTAERNISAQQEEIQNNLNMARKNLAQIYSLNVLPGKYRNFTGVATLYGYIVDGRCTIVKGHGGIYDTYDKDLLANVIVEKLSNIESSLSRIEYYQRELVNQARIANNQLASINSSLTSINNYSAQIAKNTEITAVASQQSAAALQWQNSRIWAMT